MMVTRRREGRFNEVVSGRRAWVLRTHNTLIDIAFKMMVEKHAGRQIACRRCRCDVIKPSGTYYCGGNWQRQGPSPSLHLMIR